MKHIHLKSNKDNKKLKYIVITTIFLAVTSLTFNYLNKNIYDYNTKEYLDLFTKVSFSFENNIDLVINKIIDCYDKYTNNEAIKR
ncbi:MAG: hypothetical protein IKE73_00510 [Bacilli bacterium]|nr:hypothetical protein [Bacilli bacterium]